MDPIHEPVDVAPRVRACMVVLGGFISTFMSVGIIMTHGILLLDLVEEFPDSRAQIETLGSLHYGVSLLIGLLVGALLSKFNHRQVTIVGSLFMSVSYVIVSQSHNFGVFFSFYGIIAGCGNGMIYFSGIIAVSVKFTKRRALATGIVLSGSGMGVMVCSLALEILKSHYGWRGAVLIFGAVLLNGVAAGFLLSPFFIGSNKLISQSKNVVVSKRDEKDEIRNDLPLLDAVQNETNTSIDKYNTRKTLKKSISMDEGLTPETSNGDYLYICESSIPLDMAIMSRSESFLANEPININSNSKDLACFDQPDIVTDDAHGTNLNTNTYFCNSAAKHIDNLDVISDVASTRVETNHKRKLTLLNRMREFSRRIHKSTAVSNTIACFRDRKFLCLYASGALSSVYVVVQMYLPSIVVTNGLSETVGVRTISIFGFCSMAGRFLIGLIASYAPITSLTLSGASLLVFSLAILTFPWATLPSLFYLLAVVSGLSFGASVTLRSVVLVDVLGIDMLAQTFTLVLALAGLMIVIHQAIAGELLQATSGYVAPMTLEGAMCLLAAALMMYVYVHVRRRNSNERLTGT